MTFTTDTAHKALTYTGSTVADKLPTVGGCVTPLSADVGSLSVCHPPPSPLPTPLLLRPRLWNHPLSFCLSADKLRAHLKSWPIKLDDFLGRYSRATKVGRLYRSSDIGLKLAKNL